MDTCPTRQAHLVYFERQKLLSQWGNYRIRPSWRAFETAWVRLPTSSFA